MELIIRECQMTDVEAIAKLNKNEMGYDYPIHLTIEKIKYLLQSSHDKIYVAQVKHQVVGYIHANDYDVIYMGHLKNIMGIAVDMNYQHCGIGKKLLCAVEDWAKETHAEGVRLVSGESRLGAHEFYKHCGYISHKKQMNFIKTFKSF